MGTEQHYFKFSRNWLGTERLCGECSLPYDDGNHIEINRLKVRTSYVCPDGGGLGHKSIYTGAYHLELRSLTDHICTCGLELVEEDAETWRLTFEVRTPNDPEWHTVSHVQSKHAAHQQHEGLLALIAQGEPIRNVELAQLVTTTKEA